MKYIVKSPILHNGRLYKEGEEIELTDKEAKNLSTLIKKTEEKEEKGGGKKE